MLPHDKFDAVTELSLILLQAEEKQRNDTDGSIVPSSSRSSSAIPAVACANGTRPADEGQAHLQRPQPGSQAPHEQAQPQVHSHQQLLLCFISQVAHELLCLLNFASTRSCYTVITFVYAPRISKVCSSHWLTVCSSVWCVLCRLTSSRSLGLGSRAWRQGLNGRAGRLLALKPMTPGHHHLAYYNSAGLCSSL